MLMLIGLGLGLYGIYQLFKGDTGDHVLLGLFYVAAAAIAFGALFRLYSRPAEKE